MTRHRALAALAPAEPADRPKLTNADPRYLTVSVELDQLARQVAALRLSWSDPWRFYEQRSDLAAALRRASRRVALLERLSAEAGR